VQLLLLHDYQRSEHFTKLLIGIGPRRTACKGHAHLHIEEFLVLNKIEMIRMSDIHIIELGRGWNHTRKGIKENLGANTEQPFDTGHYVLLYTNIYDMCTQKHP